MTLLFFDGCQDAATISKPEWNTTGAFANATGRDGSANGAAGQGGLKYVTFTLGSSTLIQGMAFNWSSSALFGNTALTNSWSSGDPNAPTWLLHCNLTASGFLEFRRGTTFSGGTTIGTTSGHTALTPNVWRHIQIKYVAHITSGTLIVKIDGITVLNLTGVQTSNTTATPTAYQQNAAANFGSTGQWIMDDLYICDSVDATSTQGRANNDFLGDLKVAILFPSAAGDTTEWTPSTGSNFAAVDENPTNTSDYVSTHTTGRRDLYALNDLPLGATNIYGVRVGIYAAKSDAGPSEIKPVIKEAGGTVTAQSAQPLTTSYLGYFGAQLFVKPSDGAVFTPSDVNSLQAGVELA